MAFPAESRTKEESGRAQLRAAAARSTASVAPYTCLQNLACPPYSSRRNEYGADTSCALDSDRWDLRQRVGRNTCQARGGLVGERIHTCEREESGGVG